MRLTCDQASAICDKSQYNEAGLMEKIKLGIHLFLCKKCELYTKQNKIMSKWFKRIEEAECHKRHRLNHEEIAYMTQELKIKIKS